MTIIIKYGWFLIVLIILLVLIYFCFLRDAIIDILQCRDSFFKKNKIERRI